VLPFRNLSRAPEHEWLVEGSTTMLADALARWREISVVRDDLLYPALQRHALVPGTVMEPARVRRVAEETGGWTAVTGEVVATGGRLRVSARAYDVVTGRDLVRAAQEVPGGGDVREAFERIGTALLRVAGSDTSGVELGATTTRSLDAYRAYLRGLGHNNRAQYRRARDAFLEAVSLDSTFAQAYYQLAYAALFYSPMAVFDSQSPLHGYIERAVALAERLPPRQRDVVLAVGAMLRGRFGAAHQLLGPLVAQDSNDVDAVGWLSFLHYIDPILVTDAQGQQRRRGSINTHLALAKRVLELNPARHDAYLPLFTTYAVAAGDLPGMVASFQREAADLASLFTAVPARLDVPLLLGDSITLVPADSVESWPAELVANARRRALEVTRAWVSRWLAVGPTEGEAHRAEAKVSELSGDYALALTQLARAESLGVEFLGGGIGFWRIALLGKLGRLDEAARVTDSLFSSRRFDRIFAIPTDQFEGVTWAFNLFLMRGEFARAESTAAWVGAGLSRIGIGGVGGGLTDALAARLLSGAGMGHLFQIRLPPAFRATVLDSVYARRDRLAPDSRLARALPSFVELLATEAEADSTLRTRVAGAPWRGLAPRRGP
jgi:tetratricopeptide (TPR) repeat protein